VVGLLSELRGAAGSDAGPSHEAGSTPSRTRWSLLARRRTTGQWFAAGAEAWNVRDRHMTETLERLMDRHGKAAKAVVWEHNTHVGDARYTDMADDGMVNVGQLVRESHAPDDVVIVGFGSHRGTVTASDRWGGSTQTMLLPAARRRSIERLLHDSLGKRPAALFVFGQESTTWATERRGHRAVGVVYRPDAEGGNYVPTVLARRYDAFCWIDETSALTPLHPIGRAGGEMETWPSGT